MPTLATWLMTLALGAQDPGQHVRAASVDAQGLLPVNTMYFDLAAGSGGDFYFWAPGEFASARVDMPLHGDPVLLAYGTLAPGGRQFPIAVDSGARALTVFVGVQRKDHVALTRPDGRVVRDGDAGVRWHSLQHMAIATVDSPPPGIWTLMLAGAGKHAVTAHLNTDSQADSTSFDSFDFVELRGRPGHVGLFPIDRVPRKGESLACSARISGDVDAVEFAFVSLDEQPLAAFAMHAEEEGGNLLGQCRVPDHPFRVAVSGRDRHGQPFRRVLSALHTPE